MKKDEVKVYRMTGIIEINLANLLLSTCKSEGEIVDMFYWIVRRLVLDRRLEDALDKMVEIHEHTNYKDVLSFLKVFKEWCWNIPEKEAFIGHKNSVMDNN